MKKRMTSILRVASLFLVALAFVPGCQPEGPAERAGESVDQGVDNVQDSLDPDGPMENAGESVDRTVNP